MDAHERLLGILKEQVPQKTLLVQLAAALDISYDAAHRRLAGKSKFSLDEAIRLCRYFNLSPDKIFMPGSRVLAEKTQEIKSAGDIAEYLKQSLAILNSLKNIADATIYYSAKDIPLFYTIEDSLLSKFKIYVWLTLLTGNHTERFEEYEFKGPALQYGNALRDSYSHFKVHELWNDTTINSILQQIHYYYRSGLLGIKNARLLLTDLEGILKQVDDNSQADNGRYQLYYNELLVLNNNVLVTSAQKKALFIPYNLLAYFVTYDEETCTSTEAFFRQQLKHSMPLNHSSLRDRRLFFNRGWQKINTYRQYLEADEGLLPGQLF